MFPSIKPFRSQKPGKRRITALLLAGIVLVLGLMSSAIAWPTTAFADDGIVKRIEHNFLHDRNRIVLNGMTTLRDADITIENGSRGVVKDKTITIGESGDHDEYVIDMSNVRSGKAMAVTANYRNIGIDPKTERTIGCIMRFSDIILAPEDYWNKCAERFKGRLGDDPTTPDSWNPKAHYFPYPTIRLAANFDGGYWFMGVEHAKIDLYFYYEDNTHDRVDLSRAFLTIRSIDYDGNGIVDPGSGRNEGNEAVKPESIYRSIYLTPQSLVGRHGNLTGFSGTLYESNPKSNLSDEQNMSNYFYQRVPNRESREPEYNRAITFFGVKNGSNQFVFDMIDTESWTHNMPYFGTIGAVTPPVPVKSVDDQRLYRLDDTVTWTITQKVPGRDEMLGTYDSIVIEDTVPKELRVDRITVLDEHDNEITAGVKSAPGDNAVRYQFDLGSTDVYGHTYRIVIETTVIDYPDNDTLVLKNRATSTFSNHRQETNEVGIKLEPPALQVEKHADLSAKLASSLNGFEYLSHDRHPDHYSTVHFVGSLTNVVERTRARHVTIKDVLPPGLSLVPSSVQVTGVKGASIQTEGNVLQISFESLDGRSPISFSYDCYTTDEGNGKEVINTVQAWAQNIPHETPGAPTTVAADDGEIYINDPKIEVTKTVKASAIQNDDYQESGSQQREEFRVGDEITYEVVLRNTAAGTYADNVTLIDEHIPDGLELKGDIQVTGVDLDGNHITISYPMAGKNDTIHDEVETRAIEHKLTHLHDSLEGSWGWKVDLNYLAFDYPVTVTWHVIATEEVNGWEIYNKAVATAENQPGDVFSSGKPCVWINSPHFNIEKQVNKTDKAYQVGSSVGYDVILAALPTPGTLARDTTIEDAFQTEGVSIREHSFTVTDAAKGSADLSGHVDFNRSVGENRWLVKASQIFDDKNGYWVSEDDYPVWEDGALVLQSKKNPVGVDKHDFLRIHYEAVINDMALQNEFIDNIATATSREDLPVSDNEQVTVIGAQLNIVKTSSDGGSFKVGDIADYELSITNMATGTVAENVRIEDAFTTSKAGAVAIVDGSIELFDITGAALEGFTVTYRDNEAGNHTGFLIETGYDLPSQGKIVVSYRVKYLTHNGFKVLRNTAHAWAENAPKVTDTHETRATDVDQSDLIIDKGSDKQRYMTDDIATYHLHLTNANEEQPARNIVIEDRLDPLISHLAHIVKGSVKIWDEKGNGVSGKVVYYQGQAGTIDGFSIETERDLDSKGWLDVQYNVSFSSEIAQPTEIINECWSAADNTGRATDLNEVVLTPSEIHDASIEDEPTLQFTKEADRDHAMPGDSISYTIRATVGQTDLHNLVISDRIPDGLTIVPDSFQVLLNGEIVDLETVFDQGTFEVVIGDVDAGDMAVICYTCLVDDDVELGSGLTNVATAFVDEGDPLESEATVTVDQPDEETSEDDPTLDSPYDGMEPEGNLAQTGDEHWGSLLRMAWIPGIAALAATIIAGVALRRLHRKGRDRENG